MEVRVQARELVCYIQASRTILSSFCVEVRVQAREMVCYIQASRTPMLSSLNSSTATRFLNSHSVSLPSSLPPSPPPSLPPSLPLRPPDADDSDRGSCSVRPGRGDVRALPPPPQGAVSPEPLQEDTVRSVRRRAVHVVPARVGVHRSSRGQPVAFVRRTVRIACFSRLLVLEKSPRNRLINVGKNGRLHNLSFRACMYGIHYIPKAKPFLFSSRGRAR